MGRWDKCPKESMRYISLVLSLVMIGYGIYFLAVASDSTGMGYGIGALIVGAIWLVADIIAIKKHNYDNE